MRGPGLIDVGPLKEGDRALQPLDMFRRLPSLALAAQGGGRQIVPLHVRHPMGIHHKNHPVLLKDDAAVVRRDEAIEDRDGVESARAWGIHDCPALRGFGVDRSCPVAGVGAGDGVLDEQVVAAADIGCFLQLSREGVGAGCDLVVAGAVDDAGLRERKINRVLEALQRQGGTEGLRLPKQSGLRFSGSGSGRSGAPAEKAGRCTLLLKH